MKVGDWMIPGLRGLEPDDTIRHALASILRFGINGLPVVDEENRLLGLISLSDIRAKTLPTQDDLRDHPEYMQRPETMEDRFLDVIGLKVGDVMVKNVLTVSPDMKLVQASALMQSRHVKQLPVVENDVVVGTITVRDIAWAFMTRYRKA